MRLWRVFYKPETQQKIVKDALEFGFNYKKLAVEERAKLASDSIQFFLPTFKNKDFEEEDECRLIFSPPPHCPVPVRFRIARGMLVPYYSLKELSTRRDATPFRLPIRGVRVGPSVRKDLNVESTRILLAQAGYTGVRVDCSNTPFRG